MEKFIRLNLDCIMYILPRTEWLHGCTGGYIDKALAKVGVKEYEPPTDWTLVSWKSSLEAMDYDADIVFFGDSITRGGQWAEAFPDKAIVNLGRSGDSLSGMINRVDMIASVTPEKVFVLGGINSLTDKNSEECIAQYRELIETVKETVPNAELYVQSVLPVTVDYQKNTASNESIVNFNAEIEKLADEFGITYINIFDLYAVDGALAPELTKEGIHLVTEAYDRWYDEIRPYVEE